MITIYKERNPAGDYWLDYSTKDRPLVDHLLAGSGWKPDKQSAECFAKLAEIHGVKVKWEKG